MMDRTAAFAGEPCSADFVSSLLRQFGEMQRQMFDQSMAMMFQMFRTMHGEQVGALREELERLEELNRELQDLLNQRGAVMASSVPFSAPAGNRGEPNRADAGVTSQEPAPREAPKREPTSAGAPQGVAPDPSLSPRPSRSTPPAFDPKKSAPPLSSPAEGQDVHLWLCQRMEAIQQERQGLWDRILGTLGKK
jgi:hypothetical protein